MPDSGKLSESADPSIVLCESSALSNAGLAVPFEVIYCGQKCPAFAIRYADQVHAYLNRCTHVPIEMDYQPNQFFDMSSNWLICATHGAMYSPRTGACMGGPCRGGLVKIQITELDGCVRWHTSQYLQPAPLST